MDTEFVFLSGKREMQQASTSRTVPHFLRSRGGGLYPLEGLAVLFFSCQFSKQPQLAQATQQSGLVSLKLSAHESVGGEESQVLSIIYMESESN